jgi:hypothetical protein
MMYCVICIYRNFDGKYIVDRYGNIHIPEGDIENDIMSMVQEGEF